MVEAQPADGNEAAMMTLEQQPDLCVLDATMSGIDGIRVTRLLRAADQTRLVPIVLLSTRPGAEAREAASEAGVSEYVTEPFVPGDLHVRSASCCEGARPSPKPRRCTSRVG